MDLFITISWSKILAQNEGNSILVRVAKLLRLSLVSVQKVNLMERVS